MATKKRSSLTCCVIRHGIMCGQPVVLRVKETDTIQLAERGYCATHAIAYQYRPWMKEDNAERAVEVLIHRAHTGQDSAAMLVNALQTHASALAKRLPMRAKVIRDALELNLSKAVAELFRATPPRGKTS